MKTTVSCLVAVCLILVAAPFAPAASPSRRASSRKGVPQTIAAPASDKLTAQLVAVEREFWEAWKNKQPDRFASAMADDAVFFGLYGVTNKSDLVAEQRDSINSCDVKSYALSNLRSISIDANAAILLYDAEQHATCGDQPVTPFMHGESVYARRNGRWLNILRSELPAANPQNPQ
jgi:hypothetical protein